jgi:hypothetical protein
MFFYRVHYIKYSNYRILELTSEAPEDLKNSSTTPGLTSDFLKAMQNLSSVILSSR